jgi:hypothetical protein
MKKQSFIIIAVACAALVLLAAGTATTLYAAQGKVYYTCPMPEDAAVIMDKPGKCPKCGMDLVAKKQEAAVKYTCPMHPEVLSDKAGKCTQCGMNLVPMKEQKK